MKKLIVVFLLISPLATFAQESSLGNWMIYFGNKQINDKWNWHNEVQYRNYNIAGDLEQLLLRTGMGYNLSENNNNVLLGYGFIHSENYIELTNDKQSINEHRIYQQFITKQNFSRVSLQHRYRFEQRFIGDNFKMRFRYFLSVNVALNNSEITDHTWYLSAYNEIFLNSESQVFDRDRLYGGLGYKLNDLLKFEVGYMNQFFESASSDQINLIAFVNF